jgi:tRNA pseudouridine38-40 synthase
MNRYFIQLAYKGTAYHGWQLQNNAVTVQEVLESALSLLLREKSELTGCGRTDTGVHASEFFAHFESEKDLLPAVLKKYGDKLNGLLPDDITVRSIFRVPPDMHARFSALSRTYEYRLLRRQNPFDVEFTHFYRFPLNVERMNRGAEILMEYTDFSCFSRSHTQTKTNDCRIMQARWEEHGSLLVFRITADRFLRNMVRAISGTLLELGRGKIDEDALRSIILSKDRCKAGKSMPAKALFLTHVEYPEGIVPPVAQAICSFY